MYSTNVPEISDQPIEFGTSGMLYRSNKLMYDRATETLWRQFLGEPVVGPLANSGIKLEKFPITLTTWGEWRASHPDTTVLHVDTGVYDASFYVPEDDPFAIYYNYFNSSDTMFPVWLQSEALATKAQVLGVLLGGVPKAYHIEALAETPVLNDSIGRSGLVVVTEPLHRSTRAFLVDREGVRVTFQEKLGGVLGARTLVDSNGVTWRVTDDALLPNDGSAPLLRIPTNNAFWFGWYSNKPNHLGVSAPRRVSGLEARASRVRATIPPPPSRSAGGRHGRRCPD